MFTVGSEEKRLMRILEPPTQYQPEIAAGKSKLRPELLQQPQLPPPMHGMNPRSVLGNRWWDIHRKRAYAQQNYRCWACGVHKTQAALKRWLEGHESYEIDYAQGRMRLTEIVALCHSCHNFIHSGRMFYMLEAGKLHQSTYRQIVEHGWGLLRQNDLRPWPGTVLTIHKAATSILHPNVLHRWRQDLLSESMLDWADKQMLAQEAIEVPWGAWRMIIEGKEYKPLHKDEEAWAKHYGR